MPVGSWRCLFCGGPGPKTAEHMLSRPLSRHLPAGDDMLVLQTWHQPSTRAVAEHRYDQVQPGFGRGKRKTQGRGATSSAFCASCNSGWMSEQDQQVGPILAPMIRGEKGVELEEPAQHLIAAWATKFALTIESTQGGETSREVPDAVYAEYHRANEPVAGYPIDLGRYVGAEIHHRQSRWVFRAKRPAEAAIGDGGDAVFVTFTVGRLLVEVALPTVNPRVLILPAGVFDSDRLRIWPSPGRSMRWPPRLSVPDGSFVRFSQERTVGPLPT